MRTPFKVIGIGFIVTALGCVVFSCLHWPAVKRAHAIGCVSNLKQIGLGLTQYEQDYDGLLPAGDRASQHMTWQMALWPYIKSTAVFACPSRTDAEHGNGKFPTSYAANSAGASLTGAGRVQECGPFASPNLPISRVQEPAELIALCEVQTTPDPVFDIDVPEANQILFAGHGEKSNYLLVDGHVAALSPLETGDGPSHKNMWYLNRARPLSRTGQHALGQTVKYFQHWDEDTDPD